MFFCLGASSAFQQSRYTDDVANHPLKNRHTMLVQHEYFGDSVLGGAFFPVLQRFAVMQELLNWQISFIQCFCDGLLFKPGMHIRKCIGF